MTVCVGAICQDNNVAVVASDRMVTTSMPPIEFEHTKQKIFQISPNCISLTAGNALRPVELIPKLKTILTKIPPISQVAEKTKELYQILRSNQAEDIFLRPRTISKEIFYSRGASFLPPDLFRAIDRDFTSFNYGLDILIAGVDNKAHLYGVSNPGIVNCYDTIGFHAIGIGFLHAIQIFIASSFKTSYNIDEAISIVYAAKRAAEAAPGVGQETDICLVTREQIVDLPEDIIKELANIYDEVRKTPSEEIKEKSQKLHALLTKKQLKEDDNETGGEQSSGGEDAP